MNKLIKQVEQLNKQIKELKNNRSELTEKQLKQFERGLKIHKQREIMNETDTSLSRQINGWLVPKHIGRISEKEYNTDEYKNKFPHLKTKKKRAMKKLRRSKDF